MIRLLAALCALALPLVSSRALACGGFFCSQSAPVIQNAERIVFVQNGDGTITAIVEIEYTGPSSAFSWVLPVSGVPEIDVAETAVLDAIDRRTAPVFSLTTRGEGCRSRGGCFYASDRSAGGGGEDFYDSGIPGPGVAVRAAGLVGPYEYTIISVTPGAPDPAGTATTWLEEHGYDVTAFGGNVLGSYLAQGLNLIAFRLTKNATAGSIRPVMMTFEDEHPMIPILPTAVAARNDMGVLVFLYGPRRGVPVSYSEIEISDFAIDWTQPSTSYTALVAAAVDEAEGHAFITEFAGAASGVPTSVAAGYRTELASVSGGITYLSELRLSAPGIVSSDGFVEALREGLVLPEDVTPEMVSACILNPVSASNCFELTNVLVLGTLVEAIEQSVIGPAERTEQAIGRAPYLTRLFTTLDPEEMTLDPTFTFAEHLDDVSNVHRGTQVLRCDRRDTEMTLELTNTVAGTGVVEVHAERLEGVPNPARVNRYDLYGVKTVMRDSAWELETVIKAARRRSGSGCAARERGGVPRDAFVFVVLGSTLAVLGRRRLRR